MATSLADLFRRNAGVYDALPAPRSMRLIQLQPGTTDEIACQLLTIDSIESAPNYVALSYCWGSVCNAKKICCNGRDLFVTENLYTALSVLRNSPSCQPFWIDAVCINQYNTAERNQQVSSMRDIYTSAQSVTVWLGAQDEHSGPALGLIRHIGLSHTDLAYPGLKSSEWPGELDDRQKLVHLDRAIGKRDIEGLPDPENRIWQSLSAFYSRPWFTRVWIIQEIINARKAVVTCGEEELPWSMVGFAARWFVRSAQGGRARGFVARAAKDTTPPLGPNCAAFLAVHDMTTIYESPFLRLLDLGLQSNATEPKDRIFAMLHHPISRRSADNTVHRRESTPHLDMDVDYSRPIGEVNREVATRSIIRYKSLEALNFAWRIRTPASQSPSWVAEWHAELLDRRPPLRPRLFDAAASTSPKNIRFESTNVLSLEGFHQDSISEMNPILPLRQLIPTSDSADESDGSKFVESLRAISTALVQDVNDGSGEFAGTRLGASGRTKCCRSFAAFLYTTLTNSGTKDGLVVLQPSRKCDVCLESISPAITDVPKLVRTCGICRQGNFDICESCHDLGKRCPDPTHTICSAVLPSLEWHLDAESDHFLRSLQRIAKDESPLYFQRHVNVAFNRRTLFVSARGRLGLAPLRAQPGDTIAVLFGGRTPFVLRQIQGNRYRLVSDCYVHGIMDGEAVEQSRRHGQVSEEFVLE